MYIYIYIYIYRHTYVHTFIFIRMNTCMCSISFRCRNKTRVSEQKPTNTSPRADGLSPAASANELTYIITLLTLYFSGGRR